MLQAVLDKHKAKRQELTAQAEQLEKSAAAAADKFSSLIVDELNEEVKQVYDTQRVLERESQLLKQELAAVTQQLNTWSRKTQDLLETLKHVGDLEHYVSVLKQEAAALAKVLTAAAADKGKAPPCSAVCQQPLTAEAAAATDSEASADAAHVLESAACPLPAPPAVPPEGEVGSWVEQPKPPASAANSIKPLSPAAGSEQSSAATGVAEDTPVPPALSLLPVSSRASR